MLKGKVALVTGASRGIGRAIALELARSGADIAVIYAGNAQAAAATVADIAALGVRAKAYACNVADFDAVAETVKAVTADLGPVYVLVNNAGITRDKLTLQMKQEDFQQVIDVNLKGAFNFIRHTYSSFVRSRAGRIINITSVSGLMGNAGQANYAAAKAGLIGLTKSVARELAARGVTCNAVAPGFVQTDMTDQMPASAREALLGAIPMKRGGVPEDIASAVAFLASDAAGYITGTVLQVDGGLNM
ncbi:3-oxoacyl-[acyl-carrier-protein] reductase FabG [uncultured Clostridium sp.]|nr:3-oxoacyl-[acyl-carrier-protein] reductase FabG [uncultured Clostridium sp.]